MRVLAIRLISENQFTRNISSQAVSRVEECDVCCFLKIHFSDMNFRYCVDYVWLRIYTLQWLLQEHQCITSKLCQSHSPGRTTLAGICRMERFQQQPL